MDKIKKQLELIEETFSVLATDAGEAGDTTLFATLNNIRTPVMILLDEIKHYPQEDTLTVASGILEEARERLKTILSQLNK